MLLTRSHYGWSPCFRATFHEKTHQNGKQTAHLWKMKVGKPKPRPVTYRTSDKNQSSTCEFGQNPKQHK